MRRGSYPFPATSRIHLFFLRRSMEQAAQRVHLTDSHRARQTRIYKLNQAEGPSQYLPYPNKPRRSAEPTYQRHPALEAALVGTVRGTCKHAASSPSTAIHHDALGWSKSIHNAVTCYFAFNVRALEALPRSALTEEVRC